ncbi:ankyrin repeat domain-containing protein [Haloplasma contractile]|uniref:Ankyrin repeat domain protein n=1 Tax=Haloplasma contractile SSD-17B TaxID=1033810 RepID=U2EFV7_9MOLU|nr:ankyrin repeat domain-containing protein [Haloplasma contractile]ERJ13808.1 Ankyrin repeat domain protein [Haloplasma contractile SSD-17B]
MKRVKSFDKVYIGFILLAVILIGLGVWIIIRPSHISEEEKQQIRKSIQNQVVNDYRDYMNNGKQLSFAYEDGTTIIELLVAENDLEHARQLLENGYDLSLITNHQIDVLANLIAHNKNVNNDDLNQIILTLVSHIPSELNNEDLSGFSILFNAIEADNDVVVNDLLTYEEMDVHKRYKGLTPLLFACKNANSDLRIIQSLTEHGASLEDQDELGNNCLFSAVNQQNQVLVEYLLQLDDIDVNHQNQKKQSVLHLAISNASFNIVKTLLEHDIDLSLKDVYGDTAFQSAFKFSVDSDDYLDSLFDVFDQMIAKGAPVDTVNNQGYTSLFYAIAQNNRELVGYLVENTSIDVNQQDLEGNTALLFAIKYDREELALLLLEHDGNKDIENNAGVSPKELANEKGMTAVVNKIEQN